jgi:uncharacterized repeat protein (TIGR01451 family)
MLSLIGVSFPYNAFTYDSNGHIAYDAAAHTFNLDATPLTFKPSASITRPVVADPVSGLRSVQIRINVDNSGNLIGGADGPDLIVYGSVAGYGSGLLLTGEISQFGSSDWSTTTDQYDFRFTPTGGVLASYFSGNDIGLTTNSELSDFAGDFNVNFSGGAKGNVGAVSPLLSSIGGNVYLDADNNGVFDTASGDSGIGNATVTLTGVNVDGLAVNLSLLTNPDGSYNFTALRPGLYAITETQPAGYLDGMDTVGTPGGTLGNDVISDISLAAGVAGAGNNFGEIAMQPGIRLVKLTNDQLDPNLAVGDPVTWTYQVSNTGNVALSNLTVTDDQGVAPIYKSGDLNNDTLLDTNETWIYKASGTAVKGQYSNIGTAVGTASDATDTVHVTVVATDLGHYFGVQPGINILKLTNDSDNNIAPGLEVYQGSAVTWSYIVTNTGNVALSDVKVTDSDSSVKPLYQSGDANIDGLLDLTETWIYAAAGAAIAGQYSNTGTATGKDATLTVADAVSSSDVDFYYGNIPEPASKSGYVYLDDNNDGVKQNTEAGIAGVKIILTGVNDLGQSVIITTTTDANGYYIFNGLRPGTYTVTEIQPTGTSGGGCGNHSGCGDHCMYMYQWCEGGIRHYELHASDGSVLDCSSSGANTSLIDNIFSQLCNKDWNNDDFDWDDEGLKDSLFRGCNIKSSCGSGDANDNYFADHFSDFWNGISVLCNRGSSYYLDGKDTAGSDGGIAGNDVISNIALNWGDHGVNNNFGELRPACVSGNVYVDANNDGVKQSAEKGIARVKVTLTGTDDLGNAIQLSTITNCSGTYEFGNLRPGAYTITETQPACYLDGKDSIGSQGGVAGNDVLSNIILSSGVKGTGNNFGELKPASLSGFVYLDKNGNGEIDCKDQAVANVTITLTGVDDRGNSVLMTTVTDDDGIYVFNNLRPGAYAISETQPAGYLDGADFIGSQGGIVQNDLFTNIVLQQGVKGINNNFSELPSASTTLHHGQTATIGFWNSCRGQSLIKSLNGGSCATQLGNWLAATFPNMYGASAGSRNMAGKTNAQVAKFFQQLFDVCGMKIDAQAMALALACYVTNSTLAGNVAANYGFTVSSLGTAAATYNIGAAGVLFNVTNNSVLSISQILQKTNEQAKYGVLWDLNGNGSISSAEQILRNLANDLFTNINETGDIG